MSSLCLGVSGSVAAVKTPEIAAALLAAGADVDLVVTEAAYSLLQAQYRGEQPWAQLQALLASHPEPSPTENAASRKRNRATGKSTLRIYRDQDEWSGYGAVGQDAVLHVELAKRNQVLLIAPLCANLLAQTAVGLCGNLLSSVVRAWYYDLEVRAARRARRRALLSLCRPARALSQPGFESPLAERFGLHTVRRALIVAPAMNTFMWNQRVTAEHLATLRQRGVEVVSPVVKMLACGDTGMGAMATVEDVVAAAVGALREYSRKDEQASAQGKPQFEI
jgi:phosphopantothenoylcysteine decarboxylase